MIAPPLLNLKVEVDSWRYGHHERLNWETMNHIDLEEVFRTILSEEKGKYKNDVVPFELAEKRLSADVTNFSASSSSVEKGESLRDTIQNIHVMKMDCVVMRHPIPGSCEQLTNYVDSIRMLVILNDNKTQQHYSFRTFLFGYMTAYIKYFIALGLLVA